MSDIILSFVVKFTNSVREKLELQASRDHLKKNVLKQEGSSLELQI